MAAGLIRLARDKAGLTQHELARKAGVSQQAISAYETGRKEPTLPTIERLLGAAGYEMRIRLEEMDDHDRSLERFMQALPRKTQVDLARRHRERIAESRSNRARTG